jgi:membrane peptidoglycan carboxypeptidase
MVGYTPSISTAVWMGTQGAAPIENAAGSIIYGSGLPGAIWQEYMDTVLDGTPEEPLPSKALIRGDTGEGVSAPTSQAPATTQEETPVPSSEAPAPTSSEPPVETGAPEPTTEVPGVPPPSVPVPSTTSVAVGRPPTTVPAPPSTR